MALLVREALCSGCRACEIACVAVHDGRFGTATARVRVRKSESAGTQVPAVCQACADAACITLCPTGALSRQAAGSAILLAPDDCIICSACSDACPEAALFLHPTTGLPLVCDLCDGDPACVKRCVTGALSLATATDAPAAGNRDA